MSERRIGSWMRKELLRTVWPLVALVLMLTIAFVTLTIMGGMSASKIEALEERVEELELEAERVDLADQMARANGWYEEERCRACDQTKDEVKEAGLASLSDDAFSGFTAEEEAWVTEQQFKYLKDYGKDQVVRHCWDTCDEERNWRGDTEEERLECREGCVTYYEGLEDATEKHCVQDPCLSEDLCAKWKERGYMDGYEARCVPMGGEG